MNQKVTHCLYVFVTLLIFGTYTSSASVQSNVQDPVAKSGAISGRVVNADGEPVSGAKVTASLVGVISRVPPLAETDEHGEFTIKDLSPGEYTLHVSKEEEGYTRTDSEFYSSSSTINPQVDVYEGQVARNVVIRLGPKGSWLVGRVVDAVTNKPIDNARIVLRRVDDSKIFFRTGSNQTDVKGEFRLLAPNFPFTIEVSAPGYEDWFYGKEDSSERATPLQLNSGDTKELLISLRSPKQSGR